jgi:hypothetical protein
MHLGHSKALVLGANLQKEAPNCQTGNLLNESLVKSMRCPQNQSIKKLEKNQNRTPISSDRHKCDQRIKCGQKRIDTIGRIVFKEFQNKLSKTFV